MILDTGRTTIFYRIADGTEGLTATLTTGTTVRSAHISYRITGHNGIEGVFATTNVNDPPSLSPSWGSAKTLWLAMMTNRRSDSTVTGAPTNYTGLITQANASSTMTSRQRVSSAQREPEASSEDPGSFATTGIIDTPHSATVAIRPAAPPPTTGKLVAWVKIPGQLFPSPADTIIYMYYGNPGITTAPPASFTQSVWNSDYVGVWHLKETGSGAAGEYKDSTQYTNHGQVGGGTAGYVPGLWTGTNIIDGAQDFDGTNDYISCGNDSELNITGNITLEAWVQLQDLRTTNGGGIVIKGEQYGLFQDYDADYRITFTVDATTQVWVSADGNSPNTWYHIVGVYDGSAARIYRNGTQVNSQPTSGLITIASDEVEIGRWGDPFDGPIDEVRISSVARSACWIGTEYKNQSNPGNYGSPGFYEVGGEGAAAPTAVKLTSFTAIQYSEGVLLRWKTGYEVNNLGFHVYREENGQLVRLTPEPVAGSAFLAGKGTSLTAGRHYHWWDASLSPQSSSLSPVRYWLKDIDLNGTHTMHGPVTPVISREPIPEKFRPELLSEVGLRLQEKYQHYWKVRELKEKLALKRLEVRGAPRKGLRTGNKVPLRIGPKGLEVRGYQRKLDPSATATQQFLAGRPAVKLMVREEGWYVVSQPELLAAGLSSRVDPRYLQLFVDGQEQAIRVIGGRDGRFGPRDAMEFHGMGLDTPSTDTNVYWLIEGTKPGKRIHEFKGYSGSLGSLSLSSYPHTIEKKERRIYFGALRNGDEGNFFGPLVYPAVQVDQLLDIRHLDPAASGDGLLEVALQGVTTVAHRVKVLVNEVEVGELVFEGQSRGTVSLPVSQSLLEEGENVVTLEAHGGEMDASVIETIRLTYLHTYTADDDALKFTAQAGGQLAIWGFGNSGIRVFDITDSNEVIEVIGKVESQKGSHAISFKVPRTGQRTLLALTEENVKSPEGVVANQPSSWHQERGGYDLVMISYRDFLGSLDPLRKLRESQRLKVALIDIEDLYDEFSFGVKSPKAVKDFLTRAKTKWQKPPRYVLLVGDASYDPRNYLGLGNFDLVPTKLVDTAYFETASDDWFVDFNNDGLPEMAMGRIPVQTAEEAGIIVLKIVGYEKSTTKREALLVSDKKERVDDFDFEKASEEMRALLPGSLRVRKIYRSQFSSDAQARQELITGINQGPLLVNFIGHGSIGIWNGVLTSEDVEYLTNMGLPFFVGMSCLNGHFQDIYMDSLSEALMKAPQGGAVAVWTSSGLTEPDKQAVMNKELIKLLFGTESLTLGEATARAKASASDQDIRRTWILFGDPSTRLK